MFALGSANEQAADPGGPGTVNAKLRRITAQLEQLVSASPVLVGVLTDRSGQISSGGVAQVLAPANANRKFLEIQNRSGSPLFLRFTGTAADDEFSLKLAPDATYHTGRFVPSGAVSIYGATTGQKFYAVEG